MLARCEFSMLGLARISHGTVAYRGEGKMSRTKSIDEEKMLQQNRKGSKIVTEVYESPAPDLAILNVIKGRRELLFERRVMLRCLLVL